MVFLIEYEHFFPFTLQALRKGRIWTITYNETAARVAVNKSYSFEDMQQNGI
jgi:hypothetical protein